LGSLKAKIAVCPRGEVKKLVEKNRLSELVALQTQISPRGYSLSRLKTNLPAGIIVSALNQMGDWNGMVIPLATEEKKALEKKR
jgi:hypothetical protein